MPVGIMLQQVFECKNAEFLLQQFSALRSHTFEIFNGRGEYV
jgi:hypothetical protein